VPKSSLLTKKGGLLKIYSTTTLWDRVLCKSMRKFSPHLTTLPPGLGWGGLGKGKVIHRLSTGYQQVYSQDIHKIITG